MNKEQIKNKKIREGIITFGFILEVIFYIQAGGGFYLSYITGSMKTLGLSIVLYVIGVALALGVGYLIDKNAILNYKYGLK